LFKYLDIDGARKTLQGRSVKFSRPLDFNDPFDIQLEELFGEDPEKFGLSMLDAFVAFLCGEIDYSKIPNDERKVMIAVMNTTFRSATTERRDELKRMLLTNGQFDQLYNTERMEALRKGTLEDIQKKLLDGYGVFCASERCDSLLMWAHYAAKHTGVVLRFVPDATKDSMLLVSKPVTYSKQRPLMYRTADDMIKRFFGKTEAASSAEMLDLFVFTKSMEWEYEKELRLAVPKLIKEGQSFEILKFGDNELTEVYFGCRISPADREEIATLAKVVNPNVSLYQARTDKREYALEFAKTG
jgi:hypothetical protein